jgi:hypothetical protein
MEAGISDRRDAGYIVRSVEDMEAEEGLMAEKDRNGTSIFFYGLFMDATILRSKGFHPANERKACVRGMALRLGQRAALRRAQRCSVSSGAGRCTPCFR